MAGVNVETAAKALNVTPRRVQQLVKDGMPRAERGLYDLGQCMAWYIRFLQKALEQRAGSDGTGGVLGLATERARLAKEQADKTAMENAISRRQVLLVEEVSEDLDRAFVAFRQRMLGAPTKLAPLVNPGNPTLARNTIAAEHERILAELADHFAAAASAEPRGIARRESSNSASATDTEGVGVGGSVPAAKQRNKRRARAVQD